MKNPTFWFAYIGIMLIFIGLFPAKGIFGCFTASAGAWLLAVAITDRKS